MYHQFYMVTGGIYVVQTEVNMIGRQVQREEADKGKLQGFGGDNGVVIILAPRGGDPRKYPDMYLLGGHHILLWKDRKSMCPHILFRSL